MSCFIRALGRLNRHGSRRRLLWRLSLAAPFAVSLLLSFLLGPANIDSAHASFAWLAGASLVAGTLMIVASDGLLVLVGLASFLAFPLLAGLGFHFAPAWATPIVAAVFYGSMLASAAATLTGIVVIARRLLHSHPRVLAGAVAGATLAGLGAMAAVGSQPGMGGGVSASTLLPAVNLGPVINSSQREAEPTFSADGRTMIFNCRDYDICTSHLRGSWKAGDWTSPQLLGAPISTNYVEIEPRLSPAGDKLYFTSSRPFPDGQSLPGLAMYVNALGRVAGQLGITPLGGVGQDDIWVSHLVDGVWSEPRNLSDAAGEPPVNTAYMDHCLDFSADGVEAFWTSTRPGGYGGNDIWMSRRVNGVWTPAVNLGPNVNTAGSEHHSMPSLDGRNLYVTSKRIGGYGGDDTYVATRQADNGWGTLVNLGQPINGPADDRCPTRTPDGTIFVFDSDRPGSHGSKDLWWIPWKAFDGLATDLGHAATAGAR